MSIILRKHNEIKNKNRPTQKKVHPKAFSARYTSDTLVYYDKFETKIAALERERTLKKWNREWKINLFEKFNPEWNDLYDTI